MLYPTPITNQQRALIEAAVAAAMKEFAPDVQRIKWEVTGDWAGDLSVFFKVLVSDEAGRRKSLQRLAPRLIDFVSNNLNIPELGLLPYFNFRTQSEQAETKEPAWA